MGGVPRRLTSALLWLLVPFVGVALFTVSVLLDRRLPDTDDWYRIAVLGGIGLVGSFYNLPRRRSAQAGTVAPWDAQTVWLVPAVLFTPPAAFAVLVLISVIFTLVSSRVSLLYRVNTAAITLATAAGVHLVSRLPLAFAAMALAALAVHLFIGGLAAGSIIRTTLTVDDRALWVDRRWVFIEAGAMVCGILIGAAMRTDILIGLLGLAPLLMAQQALRWPELSRHARLDSKTGLANAGHWEERSRRLLAVAAERRWPAALLMIDIDHFKTVNDTFGHLAGDQVLAGVAAALRSTTRSGDVVGRFGGEEFVVMAFGLDDAGARQAAERIRSELARTAHTVRGLDGGAATVEPVTCTIGIATAAQFGYDQQTLLRQADKALHLGKVRGRDRVELAAKPPAAHDVEAGLHPVVARQH